MNQMIKLVALAVLAIVTASPTLTFAKGGGHGGSHSSVVHVTGHTTKTGVYVPPHNRTSPDNTKLNNWSTKGNVNPYTGKEGTKDPYSH